MDLIADADRAAHLADEDRAHRHGHDFLRRDHDRNARKVQAVLALSTITMVAEVVGGVATGSMALLADGMHMATHAGAMLIAAGAYWLARRHLGDARFSFGPGKFGELGAFASAVILALTALLIVLESLERLFNPHPIAFAQALPVAFLGLVVNVASAWLLRDSHDHDHGHDHHGHGHDHHDHAHEHHHRHHGDEHEHHGHGHEHHHEHGHDLNLRAAYVHVAADAAVSVLAIVGLLAGRQLGWVWMDPAMGLVGAAVIGRWSWGLIRAAGAVLVDMRPSAALEREVLERLETGGDRVVDLHVWRIGAGADSLIAAVLTDDPHAPDAYRERLHDLPTLRHVTIEVRPRGGSPAHRHEPAHHHAHA